MNRPCSPPCDASIARAARAGLFARGLRAAALLGLSWLAAIILPAHASAQGLRRPFACDGCIANWFYFDHDATSGLEDWNCRASTYDGHGGTDFSLRGGNASIDAGNDVVASADGVVIGVEDGHYDRCRACASSGTQCTLTTANYVTVRHAEMTTRYVHLRLGSVRVAVGDTVTCGQVLGQIGSSGCSTGAHLHFEVRPRNDDRLRRFDPFTGACSTPPVPTWIEQGPHRGVPGAVCEPGAVLDAGAADASTPRDADVALDASTPADAAAVFDGAVVDAAAVLDAAGRDAAVRGPIEGGCACRASAGRASAVVPSCLVAGLVVALRLRARGPRSRPASPSRRIA